MIEYTDGLRTWQATIVRLWSASDEASATLTLAWLPDGPAWSAFLEHGDGQVSEKIQVASMDTAQQALQRLWKHSQPYRQMFVAEGEDAEFPADLPENAWLTGDEQSVLDQLRSILEPHQPVALRLSYRPELGLSSCWVAVLYDPKIESPQGVKIELHGGEFTEVCRLLIDAAGA